MKVILFTCTILLFISSAGVAQQWQTVVSLDSKVGYSTNTFLNSFLSEWNTASESPYNITSVFGKTYWHKNKSSVSLTGGLYYEPVFQNTVNNWKGGVGLVDMNHRLSDNFRLGFEGGGSYLNGPFNRSTSWLQPKVTWFISPYSLIRVKAGSNFRGYQNYSEEGDSYNRFDLYSLEFETWPSYQWRLTAGLYGDLDTLPAIQEGFNIQISGSYHFRNGANLSINAGLQQYQLSTTTTDGDGSPIGGGLPTNPNETTATETDRMWKTGIEASIPLNTRLSVFSKADMLHFNSEASDYSRADYQVSAGVRFSFKPQISKSNSGIHPEWENEDESHTISVDYSGDGQLYLVGTFNNWDKPGIPLTKQTDNTYVATLSLSPGAYEYRILHVQGNSQEWLEFSDEIYTVDDGFDSENAMLLVE